MEFAFQKNYKTNNPNFFITAVSCFVNIQNTVEKISQYCNTKENQEDPIRLEIVSLYEYLHGRYFIPLYFEDTCPKLKKLAAYNTLPPGMFWCIAYRNPCLQIFSTRDRIFTDYSYEKYRELLNYSIENLSDFYSKFLFERTIKQYVYESTDFFFGATKIKKIFYNRKFLFFRCYFKYE